MSSFFPGQTDQPDWERVPQFTGQLIVNDNAGLTAGVVNYGPFYVGDSQSLTFEFQQNTLSQPWELDFTWYQDFAHTKKVQEIVYQGAKGTIATDTLPNLGPFVIVTVDAVGAQISYQLQVAKVLAPAGASFPLQNVPDMDQDNNTIGAGSTATFYSNYVSIRPHTIYMEIDSAATVPWIEWGVVDEGNHFFTLAETNVTTPRGKLVCQEVRYPGPFQTFATVHNPGAGAVNYTVNVIIG